MSCPRRHTCWQRDVTGKGHLGRAVREPRNPGELLCQAGFTVMGLASGFSLSSHWLRVLPGGAHTAQPSWMPIGRILGGGRTRGVSFWPFLDSSGWWCLISFVFLTRTSCHKITHTNGYYGVWSGWVVSVRVLPLTSLCQWPQFHLCIECFLAFTLSTLITPFFGCEELGSHFPQHIYLST